MSKRVLILVEGQTEERFVKDVLGPAFWEKEEINERPQFAPSKRIQALFPAYKKTLHGPTAAARIGQDRIRAQCPHFDGWIGRLEAFAAS